MSTASTDIDALLAVRSEGEHLEFKAAENRYDFEELVDYCVALANEGGGRMILGVTDKSPRRVVGSKAFDTPERTVGGLYERLHLKITFEEVAHRDGRVLIFHVPSRPVGQPIHYKGRYLMRAGEELVPMSPDYLKQIFAEGGTEWILQPAMTGCDGAQVVQLLDTQSYFDLLHLPYPATRDAVLERFAREHLIEQKGQHWSVTNLGAILFAKQLKDFDRLARKAPRVIVYDGVSKLKTKADKPGAKGYAVGFEGLVEFINDSLPSNEVIGRVASSTNTSRATSGWPISCAVWASAKKKAAESIKSCRRRKRLNCQLLIFEWASGERPSFFSGLWISKKWIAMIESVRATSIVVFAT